MKTVTVNASDLVNGDTVMIDGEMKTVGRESVKTDFFGTLVFGQRFSGGVEKVLFAKWFKGEIVDCVSQV